MTVRLSPERIAQAKAMRDSGVPWEDIGDRLGCSKYTLKSVLIEGWRDRRNECTRLNRRVKRGSPGARPARIAIKNDRCGEFATKAPDDVLADRERRAMLEPRSLTAALQGDPLPGRSALDQRKPRLVHSSD